MHYIDKDSRGHLSIHALHKPEWGAASELCPQRGIVTYRLAPNRVNPMAGALHAAVFNVWRRTRQQILYWGTPMLLGYLTLQWAEERNKFANSKEGRKLYQKED
ncbi:Ubiquinol-cytochrome c reductase subunit 8 [Lasiodiplodia theobromae]|uniref:Ubiquinol-cytochrome c reductase subunit 8 n=1 Tax=Lasiodiplodia theobromae TaxID=45133 RepID=UPI0015C36A30|nr:Ubiquinol-cytochrome c reductase subunit 8 [Lasiodiplodia theobromae]KAF4540586.1 Ubiquinol-cytochrome c reductase subunit 8 [Lasiodiplodia theobromae]